MAKTTKAVAVVQSQDLASVNSFIETAVKTGASVDAMERLFGLRERAQAIFAKSEFVRALADFQKVCPVIKKTKAVMNKDGRSVRFKYAPMDSVIEQVKRPLSSNGFSYTWDVVHDANHMKVTCRLTHVAGHAETSTFEIPIVQSEYMTSPQSYATAQTFAKRYTFLNVLGIATADEDTDATDTKKEKDALSPKAKIVFLLRTLKVPHKTKEEIEHSVKTQTGLALSEGKYAEIVGRLEEVVKENHENQKV